MESRKYRFYLSLLLAAAVPALVLGWNGAWGRTEDIPLQQTEASTGAAGGGTVLLGGMPVGIYMETDGVMVLNTEQIEGIDGKEYEPAANLVRSGDYITAVDHREISGKRELLEAVEEISGGKVILTIRRGDEIMDIKLDPVEYAPDEYRLGIWVRDNVQGLGTVTFLTDQSRFGALGHGIHDTDTSVLMSISDGTVYRTAYRILSGALTARREVWKGS